MLGLPEQPQTRLLLRAERQRWTVRQVEREAARVLRPKNRRGRPPLPAFVKTIHSLRRFVAAPEVNFGDVDRADRLDPSKRAELREVVQALKARCDELEERLTGPERSND